RPGDGRGVVEVGVIAVGALESPAPAREVRTTRPPVARIVEQLPRLEPLESAERCGACAGGALLLHREARERGVPDGRHARPTVGARVVLDQELFQRALRAATVRMIRGVSANAE